MVATVDRDWRLQGAVRAEAFTSLADAVVPVLATVSPVTERLVVADLRNRLSAAPDLWLRGLAPRTLAVNLDTSDIWVWCDSGWLVRCHVSDAGVPIEVARSLVGVPTEHNWVVLARSTAETGRRVAAGRAPGTPSLNGTTAELVEKLPSGTPRRRIIDVRSPYLVIGSVGPGTVAVFSTETDGIVEVSRLSGLTSRAEQAAYDASTGYLYLVDSQGRGNILELMPDSTLRFVAAFTFPGVRGPIRAQIVLGFLFVCIEQRNRVIVWDLTDPEDPVATNDTVYPPGAYPVNPIRLVNMMTGDSIRKFGSLSDVLTSDLPVTDYGEANADTLQEFVWVLHGEIAALSAQVGSPP